MISDDFLDGTIANLKVIGMVPQNGRLCVRKGNICLDKDGQFQSMRRWMRGDSRDLTLMHIRNTINNAARILGHLGTSSNSIASGTVRRIVAEMQQCEIGLQNLRTTYASDSLMFANINVLIERLNIHRNTWCPPVVTQHIIARSDVPTVNVVEQKDGETNSEDV